MEKKNHNRSSSHGRKLQSTNPKTPRPALHKRHSSHHHAGSSHFHASSSTSKLTTLGATKKSGTEVISTDEEENGMASFLQFCATCEKQIVTPGKSILYCSESCRRRDISNPTPDPTLYSPSILPPTTSYFDTEILPQRSPTILRPLSFASDDPSLSPTDSPPKHSEAHQYLSQFHSSSYTHAPPHRTQRPRATRSSTATESTGIPSLTHTPSSSIGTAGSLSSYRPLPPRHDPLSNGHAASKSVELVMPVYPPPPATSAMAPAAEQGSLNSSVSTLTPAKPRADDAGCSAGAEVQFSKRSQQGRNGSSGGGSSGGGVVGSLKQLFGHEAMRSSPN